MYGLLGNYSYVQVMRLQWVDYWKTSYVKSCGYSRWTTGKLQLCANRAVTRSVCSVGDLAACNECCYSVWTSHTVANPSQCRIILEGTNAKLGSFSLFLSLSISIPSVSFGLYACVLECPPGVRGTRMLTIHVEE